MSRPQFRITFSDRLVDIDFDIGQPELRCPNLWFENVVNAAPDYATEFNNQGLAGHELAHRYGQHCVKHKIPKDMHFFDELMRLQTEDGLFGYEFEAQEDFYQTAYNFASAVMFNPQLDHHFESRFAFERDTLKRLQVIDGPNRYNIAETCDYIAGTVDHFALDKDKWIGYLTDYKMGYVNFDDWTAAETSLQMMLYAWACFQLWPELQKVSATLWGPMWGRNNKAVATFEREDTLSKVSTWLEYQWILIDSYWADYGSKPWPAHEGDACTYCNIICPHYAATADQYPEETMKVKL